MYLIQQFIPGEDLLNELKKQGTFDQTKIRELLNELLPILQFIHDNKVIHRDLKPDNIMRRQVDGKLILIDFGVAKQKGGTLLTQQGTTVGTPGYAPIEQMNGVTYPASDLYSLGVTCIRLMTGCLRKLDGSDELFNHLEGGWAWRDKLPSGITVTTELGDILDKLLQDYAKQRYQSAAEVLSVLRQQPTPIPPSQPATQPLGTTIIVNPIPSVKSPTPPTPSIPTIVTPQANFQLKTFGFEVVTLKVVEQPGFWGNKTTIETYKNRAQANYFVEDLGGGITLEMVEISGGRFTMGSPASEAGRKDNESPQHEVTISPFFMGKFTVTQAQWQAVASLPKIKTDLKSDPSNFKGKNQPVERVSWYGAVEFCARLSQKSGRTYRLPSETEWEYACRAGTTTPFHFGQTITTDLANYNGNYTYGSAPKGKYREQTTEVGTFSPNAFGLYDMHGNVWEWCADVWHENYNSAPANGSVWSAGGDNSIRILRGGSWYDFPRSCRSADRVGFGPDYDYDFSGFRVLLSSPGS